MHGGSPERALMPAARPVVQSCRPFALAGVIGRAADQDFVAGGPTSRVVGRIELEHGGGHERGSAVDGKELRISVGPYIDVGAGGKAYRYGGEEFTMLFPGRSIEDVYDALEALREDVGQSEFTLRAKYRPRVKPEHKPERKKPPKHTSITISIGVAQPDDEAWSAQEVLKAADKALYRAKEKGRDQVSD